METYFKNIIMLIGSNEGLLIIWILAYTFYVVIRTHKYLYILWLLIPIVPIVHFLINKKTKSVWVGFSIIALMHLSFIYFLEPSIAGENIKQIIFNYDNRQYIIKGKNQLRLITNIKWDLYKSDFFRNLGIKEKSINTMGTMQISVGKNYAIVRRYNLRKIVNVLEATK